MRAVLSVFGLGVLAVVIATATFLTGYRAVNAQAMRDEARSADAIVVFGSAVWPGGRPSPSLRVRIEHAIGLYKSGYAPVLYLSGGTGRFPPSEAAVMRRLALEAGVPERALVLDQEATSTQESAGNAAREAKAQGWRRVLVVSEPFHMLRARQMVRDAGNGQGLEAYASPAGGSSLQRIDRLRRYYTSREVLALAWYYSAGSIGRLAPVA